MELFSTTSDDYLPLIMVIKGGFVPTFCTFWGFQPSDKAMRASDPIRLSSSTAPRLANLNSREFWLAIPVQPEVDL